MKYAINSWVYGEEPLRETFGRLKRYGYDGVELKGTFDQYPVDEVKALCQEFGLQVTSVLGWNIYPIPGRDLASPDPAERTAALEYGKECIDFAVALGAPVLIVLPAPANRTAPVGNPQGEAAWKAAFQLEWYLAVDSVRQTAAYAETKGITLAIEPISRYETYMLTTVDDVLRFVAEVGAENVKINLDAFHMNIDEADLAQAVRKAGKLLVHMHAADSNRQAPGRGHTDFRAILQALKEVDFQGAFVLEPVPPGADPGIAITRSDYLFLRDVYAEEAIKYLKGIEAEFK